MYSSVSFYPNLRIAILELKEHYLTSKSQDKSLRLLVIYFKSNEVINFNFSPIIFAKEVAMDRLAYFNPLLVNV